MKLSKGTKTILALLVAARLPLEQRVPLTFTGGHETDRRDGGRPVALIAAALGVRPEVFREAFSHVTPARGGEPEPSQVRRNKEALLSALGKYGITNERLDEVSNYYRYRPERGEMWPTRPAKGYAVVEKGRVIRIVLTDRGSGYTTPPQVRLNERPLPKAKVKLSFSRRFEENGSVAADSIDSKWRESPDSRTEH